MDMCSVAPTIRVEDLPKKWVNPTLRNLKDMTRKNTMPKDQVRALRRSLASIAPENSNPQLQSPLFAVLPSEVRNLIFEYAVCQNIDPQNSLPETQNSRIRPGHDLRPVIDTALLSTCRLIYYETRAIPLRSTTHHVYGDQAASYNAEDWDHYLFHISSQSGQNLHHLHVTSWRMPQFNKHLKQHLHWRKMTWTVCAAEWDSLNYNSAEPDIVLANTVSSDLRQSLFPSTCAEVNLEFETLKKYPKWERRLREVIDACRKIQLSRRDGSKLKLDEAYSTDYTWEGSAWQPGDWTRGPGGYVNATYHVTRLCWREEVAEREYMHYDHWDCLRSSKVKPVPLEHDSESE